MEKQMHIKFDETYANGGVTFSQFIKDDYFQQQFKDWMEDGNVSKRADGTYSTQDAQYRNSLKGIGELKKYFFNEFIKGQYSNYANGGGVDKYDMEMLKRKKEEMNIALNTQTGQVYVGGIKPKNKLYSDEKGYFLIDGYDKFMGKKYPIKKYFSPIENYVLSNYMNDKFKDGGSLDDKVLIAKAIEYITGSAIERDSIQFEANKIAFRYKGQKTFTDISQKLIENTISMHRKSLEGRYADGGSINQSIGLDDRKGVLRNKMKYDDYITNRYFYNVGKIGYATKDFYPKGMRNISKGTPYLIIGDGNVSKKEYDEVFSKTKLLVKIGSEFYDYDYFDLVILDNKFEQGGSVAKGYSVFNYTDNIYATDEVFKTKKSANDFIKEFRNRFSKQGYYRDNRMNKIDIKDIDLLAIPSDFNPFGKFAKGGKAGNDIYDFDKKMALINLGQVYEYAIKIDKMIKENTDLEEWVKMKLTRVEQNISDVKHSLEGWEKYKSGGEIAKKQLLHIAKYSKDLIKMIEGGSKLMSWQEGKLAVSSDSIDNIYHHLDYQMGNRAEDLDVDGKYKDGGEVQYETKRIVNEAKNQKKNTHFAIHKPTNSIVFTWDYSGYDTKEMNENKEHYFYYDVKDIVSGNVDKYVKSDYAIVQRKDLEKRGIDLNNYLVFLGQKYDRSESNSNTDSGEAGFNDEGTSMVLYHEKNGNFLIPKGQVYLYLYDVEDSRGKLQSEEYDWVFYPYASQNMAWASDFIPPLKKIWTKKFQKDHKGSEHLLGVIKAYLIEENGKKELYIDMMSVNPTKMKKGIMSYMIKELRDTFKLEQDQVTFSQLTDEGEKFVAKGKYEDGGELFNLIKVEKDPMAYWVEYQGERIGNVAGIGRFNDWSWSLRTDKVDTTSTFGVFKTKEDASKKVIDEYKKRNKFTDGGGVSKPIILVNPYNENGIFIDDKGKDNILQIMNNVSFKKFGNEFRKHIDPYFKQEMNLERVNSSKTGMSWSELASYIIGDGSYNLEQEQYENFIKEFNTNYNKYADGGGVENKIQLKNFSDLKQGDVIRRKERLGTTIFVVVKSPVQSRMYKNEYNAFVTCIVSNTNFYKPLEQYYITSVIKYGKLGNVDYLGKWNYDDKIDYSIYLPKSHKKLADGGEIKYDLDGNKYMIDNDNYEPFKDGDLAYNPFYDSVVTIYFDKNDENADNEDYVNNTYSRVKIIKKFADGGNIEEIKTKYQIAGSDKSGVYTYSKRVADEIAKMYSGDVQEDGNKWYVRLEEKYADGGDIPHEDKMFQLPLEMVVYVPSTQDVDKVISVDKMASRVNEVKEYLGNKFGGYSSADKLGGFVDSKGNLINEDVTQVTSFATKEAFEENKEELVKQLAKWGKEWGQEAIGFEFEGDLMYVPQEI